MSIPKITVTIPTMPTAPGPSDDLIEFDKKAYAWTNEWPVLSSRLNTLVAQLNLLVDGMNTVYGQDARTIMEANLNLLADDSGKYLRFISDLEKTLNVRNNNAAQLPADGIWHIRNHGASDLTINPAFGVTINVPTEGSLIVPSGGTVSLKRISINVFDLFGLTVPASEIPVEE